MLQHEYNGRNYELDAKESFAIVNVVDQEDGVLEVRNVEKTYKKLSDFSKAVKKALALQHKREQSAFRQCSSPTALLRLHYVIVADGAEKALTTQRLLNRLIMDGLAIKIK